jgi:hypothetical protein
VSIDTTKTNDQVASEQPERAPEGSAPLSVARMPQDRMRARIKADLAREAERIEATYTEHEADPEAAQRFLSESLAALATARSAETTWQPTPLAFDFDADPEEPDWIVQGVIERETLVLLSGDTGAAKSICVDALADAVCHDGDWLGHEARAERVLVVDEENPERTARSRLRALGMTNAARERLRYFNREGFSIGDAGYSDAALRTQLEAFRPDLVIVDTVMAACDLEDVNNNAEAVRLLKFMRGLAREFECAFVVLHHERKQSKEHPASSGQAMMGARQWAGQADAHMTLTVESELVEEEAETEGHRTLRRTFKWRPAEKDRDGRANIPQRVAVTSEKDANGSLLWMLVLNEGEIEEAKSETEALSVTLGSLVQRDGEQIATATLAARVPRDPQDSTFKRALKAAEASGYIEKVKRGVWGPGDTAVLDL